MDTKILHLRFKSIHWSYNIHTCFPIIASNVMALQWWKELGANTLPPNTKFIITSEKFECSITCTQTCLAYRLNCQPDLEVGAELSFPTSTSLGYATCPGGFFNANKGNYRPQRSCGKVMFLHLSVILSTGGVSASVHAGIHPHGQTPPSHPPGQTTPGRHPLGRHPLGRYTLPPPADGYCSGRYTSYWNAFLLRTMPS